MLKFLTFLAALLPGAVVAQAHWEGAGARVQTVIYTCDKAMDELSVAYFTAADGAGFAAVQIGGVVHALVQEPSGSGVRYRDINAQSGYRLHAKGEMLLLLRQLDETGAEETILAECAARQG